jgi:hypothetical protein
MISTLSTLALPVWVEEPGDALVGSDESGLTGSAGAGVTARAGAGSTVGSTAGGWISGRQAAAAAIQSATTASSLARDTDLSL